MVAHSQNTKQGDIVLSLTVAFMQGGQPIVSIVSIDMEAGKRYIIISDFLVLVNVVRRLISDTDVTPSNFLNMISLCSPRRHWRMRIQRCGFFALIPFNGVFLTST